MSLLGPIGMFDSGVGGLTVARQVMQKLPRESVVYFGDTARLPYGDKSRETIIRYSIENVNFLLEHQIKMVVIACNTVTAYAMESLKERFDLPIIGVVEPGVEKAVKLTQNRHIAVLGTRATIQSGVYQKEIQTRLPDVHIAAIACPLFVPLVEENYMNHTATRLIIKEYLQPLKKLPIDTLLLGCTHYPLLSSLIQEEVGFDVCIVDSATACAEKVEAVLSQLQLEGDCEQAEYKYYVSDDPEKFRQLGQAFLGSAIRVVDRNCQLIA